MPADQASAVDWIGPYRILARLGAGGMGEVFLAYDDRLDRKVAIKRIRPEGDTLPERRERFRREARMAARLSHAAIVQVYDILQENETDHLVMEYVEGRTLREILRQGPLKVRQVLEMARDLAGGLDAAHRAGIIHRDLKTENVLISASGAPKIMDFGVAKRLLAEDGEESLTADHAVIGTCRSMSPEQARGEPVDHSTDLFAFGVLLYEALTEISPFAARDRVSTLTRVVLERQRPVRQLNPEVPEELSALVDRLLEKSAALRPSSAAEVRQELEEILARLGSSTGPLPLLEATEATAATTWADGRMPPSLVEAPGRPLPAAGPISFRHVFLGAALPLMAALFLATLFLGRGARDLADLTQPVDRLAPAGARSTFAVLRFQDRSATGESSWMSTAFPEMITDLLRIDGRISGAARRDVPPAERDLRLAELDGLGMYQQRLDVDYLIAGSYEAREDEKLIVRFLILDRTGRRYLSEVLPGSVTGLVQLSSEIAGVVRRELGLPLLGAGGRSAVDAIYADLPPAAWPGYFDGLRHQYGANHEKAADLLAGTVPLAPRSPLPGMALALSLRFRGQRAGAARAACEAGRLARRLPAYDSAEIRALCAESSGRPDEARNIYRSLLRDNPREQARYRLRIVALDLRETDRMNDALNVLQDLRRAEPATLRKIDLLTADRQEAAILHQKGRLAEARRLAHGVAERAGALHAFEEAAHAHRIEGQSLVALKDYHGAIVPLREACTRLAALRDEIRVAHCHLILVQAQFFSDRTPLYDLLAESRETYLELQDMAGVGRVIQTESVLRQGRGEHAEAERLAREAEAIFTRIGADRELAYGRHQMGVHFLFLGELPEARKALDQAYADLSRQGELTTRASALRNLGEIHFLRGDLRGARQAFETAPASYSSYWLALIAAAEGRSARAVDLLKPLLAQEEPRDPALAAQIAMALADLRSADGAAEEALAFVRRAEQNLAGSGQRDLAILTQLQLVKIDLARRDVDAADERFEALREQARTSMDYRVVLDSGITAARLQGLLRGGRQREQALEELARIERGCREKENVIYAFEARLAAGELMRPPHKGETLEGIVREARRLGLERIARRAEKARGEG